MSRDTPRQVLAVSADHRIVAGETLQASPVWGVSPAERVMPTRQDHPISRLQPPACLGTLSAGPRLDFLDTGAPALYETPCPNRRTSSQWVTLR